MLTRHVAMLAAPLLATSIAWAQPTTGGPAKLDADALGAGAMPGATLMVLGDRVHGPLFTLPSGGGGSPAGGGSDPPSPATAMSAAQRAEIARLRAGAGGGSVLPQVSCDDNVNLPNATYVNSLIVIAGGVCPASRPPTPSPNS